MDNFQKSLKNTFVARGLERVHHHRKDPEWIERRISDAGSLFVPVLQSKILVSEGDVTGAVLLNREQLKGHVEEDSIFFLGEREGHAYFAVDMKEDAGVVFDRLGRFCDLRAVAPLLSRDDGALLAYAKTITYWHKRNRFCGACGHLNEVRDGGHFRVCVNPQCGVLHFPRTDPAIIVLVKSGEKCLLGRQRVWPERMHSVLAGFVEPGESAESAVAREVFEEVGLRVYNILYHSSQPWPFPCSLMLGFTADALDEQIDLGDDELESARWFSRRELVEAVDDGVVKLPTAISISYRLIEEWFDAEGPLLFSEFAGREFRK